MPPTAEQEFAAAIAHFEAGDTAGAQGACERTLALAPGHAQATHMLGVFRFDQGELEESERLLRAAVAAEPGHPGPHFSLGNTLLARACAREAADAFRAAVTLDPGHGRAWNHLAVALQELGELEWAARAAREAVALLPEMAPARANLGLILMRRGDIEGAEAAFEAAVRLAPELPEPAANLALLAEQANRLEHAEARTRDGLARWPQQPLFNLVAARLARRAGRYEDALACLDRAQLDEASPRVRKEFEFESGRCLDGKGDYRAAWGHFTEGNRRAAAAWGIDAKSPRSYLDDIAVLREVYSRDWVGRWRPAPPAVSPAFLIGFPRSGTTLLDTLLGNAGLKVLEERPTVRAVLQEVTRLPGGNPAALASLSPERIESLRALYLRTAAETVPFDAANELLDKSPFNISNVGLIHRLFPDAPIIMLLRHPLDACLSCFMNDFERNAGTENFTTLADTARLYSHLMGLWQHYKETLELRFLEVRYEDLVDAPQQTLASLLDFLGREKQEPDADHTRHALERGRIPTPSYHQVTRPVYRDSRFRWKRYAEMLAPIRPTLEPFIDAFGYSE